MNDSNKLLTQAEVEAATGLSKSKLRALRRAGKFPQFAATGTKAGFYWAIQVDAWLTARRLAGSAAQ
jgi:predicted DNA-binding transcriptional regulator AlpA